MELINSLRQNPAEIEDLNLVERIIATLDSLSMSGTEYVFAHIQSRMLGGSYLPVPVDYKCSSTSLVLEKYNKSYFEQKMNELKKSA
jgi:hypothetical protein